MTSPQLTGDASWSSATMRTYFERIENCRHRPVHRWLAKLGINPTRHGWNGWLPTEKTIPRAVIGDRQLTRVIIDSAFEAFMEDGHRMDRVRWFLQSLFDPNDWRLVQGNAIGVRYLPLTTDGHARTGARERVLDVARRYPDRLRVVLNALATRVLLDEDQPRDRRGVSPGRAALPRAHAAKRPARRAARALRVARGRFLRAARSIRRSS